MNEKTEINDSKKMLNLSQFLQICLKNEISSEEKNQKIQFLRQFQYFGQGIRNESYDKFDSLLLKLAQNLDVEIYPPNNEMISNFWPELSTTRIIDQHNQWG
ncbi:hypothetical protein PPERSA_04446 [Pseudocohnilembus persalinus]|uniref:Uncharacterized protein n=1 Tax=Pseudocohnilembus persalinus TaxID=266149 RepID=A0A0V0QR62_PSEPJ|nr:hypothetical protein PPERSA_04446 [Pseudocohnilembus persalinus]|eukprot:KRX04631.1 hypothetical protein PPERSA_04446 [Pseudocohnilembus persalinus]